VKIESAVEISVSGLKNWIVHVQILQWLSNMPVELEGYIRSGCTILTLFIAMPQSMWDKLYADWAGAVTKLVQGSQSVAGFWDRGYFKAKLGQETVHFEDGEDRSPFCLIHIFWFLYI
jgi:hypothetical protein